MEYIKQVAEAGFIGSKGGFFSNRFYFTWQGKIYKKTKELQELQEVDFLKEIVSNKIPLYKSKAKSLSDKFASFKQALKQLKG